MTAKCGSCGAPLKPGSLFCLKCGSRVAPPEDDVATPRGTIFSPGIPHRGTAPLPDPADSAEAAAAADAPAEAAAAGEATPAGSAREPEGERRIVTVLFSDISGYTAFSERMDPEAVAEVVGGLFRALTEPIYRFGGIVDKYIGDAIMAVFGAPIAHEDDPTRAIRAALQMHAAAGTFSADLQARTGLQIRIRIGINTGLVVAGAVGATRKRSYTVIGDAVNVAQRLEAAAPESGILVGHDTWAAAREEFRFAEAGDVLVRGREAAVRAFEVLGEADAIAGAPGEPLRGQGLRLLARDAELAELGRAWSDAQAGEPVVLYVRGAAGMGKTALLREAFGDSVCWVRAAAYESSDTLGLAARIARRFLGVAGPDPERGTLAAAVRRIRQSAADEEESAELLELLLTGRVAASLANIGPEHRRAMIFKALAGLLVSAAKQQPVAMVIDDLHWIDDGSAEFLLTLFKALAKGRARFLLALAYRPGSRIVPMPGGIIPTREIALKPLPPEEAAALLEARLGAEPFAALDQEERERLLVARLDALGLPPVARKALEVGAVLAEHATVTRVATLVGDPDARSAIDALIDQGILELDPARPGSLAFAEGLLQEAAYLRILIEERRRLHGAAAKLLEAEFQSPAVVAEHFARAEMAPSAAEFHLLAAEHSLSLYSNHEALHHVEDARKWAGKLDGGQVPRDFEWRCLAAEAEASAAVGNLDQAVAAAERLVALGAGDPGRLGEAYDRLADYLSRLGRHQDASARCEEGIGRVGTGSAAALQLVGRRANSWIQLGDHAAAASEAMEALEAARPEAFKLRGFLLGCAGLAQHRLGQGSVAIGLLREALDAQQRAGNLYGAAHCLNNLGSAAEAAGEVADATRFFNRGLQIATRIGDRRLVSMLMNNLGTLEFNRGHVERAKECFVRALEAHREMQDRQGEGISLVNLGEVLFNLGERAEAEQYLMQALLVLEEIGLKGVLAAAYRLLAQVKMSRERYREALELLQRSTALARDTGQADLYGSQLRLLGEVYAALDRMDEAVTWAARSLEVLQGITAPLEQGRTYALLAKLLAESGRIPQAQEAAREARKLFEQTGARQDLDKFEPLAELLLAGRR